MLQAFSQKNRCLRIVVETIARPIASSRVNAESLFQIILAVQVNPFEGSGCGICFHCIEQRFGKALASELRTDIKALTLPCRPNG